MNFPFYIAKRYLFSKSSNNAINIITLISAIGVTIATMALFVVLSGFSGLKTFSKAFYQASDPDIKVMVTKGKTFLFTDSIENILKKDESIAFYTKILEERAFFNYQNKEHIAYLKGVDQHYNDVVKMDTTLLGGDWLNPLQPYGIVMGNSISNKLSLGIDYQNPVSIYVPKPGNTYDLTNTASLVNTTKGMSIGVFAITDEVDSKYVFANLPIVQELLQYPINRISGIEIKLNSEVNPENFANSLQAKLGANFLVRTREQLNAVFYKMLKTENLVLYFIFTLVLIIALFNIIGTIIMMILDKQTNLKTLFNLGVEVPNLQKIFIYQGFLLSMIGLMVGLIIGIFVVFIQSKYQLVKISAGLAYPVKFSFENVLIVVITMVVLSYFASKIAGSRIQTKMLE